MSYVKYENLPEPECIRKDIMNLLAKADGKYMAMMQQCMELETKYEQVINTITTEQMDTICDFLTHCEAMSDRLLELACTYMRFPE